MARVHVRLGGDDVVLRAVDVLLGGLLVRDRALVEDDLGGGRALRDRLPPDALPMALLRPLSGSGAYGILASIINDPAVGPGSYTGYLVSTFQGSTETTFYVIAVYFGAVQIRRLRYALIPALSADLAGIAAAVFIVAMLYG